MKKFTFVAAMAIAAASIVSSCGNSTSSKPNLKDDVDTLSYAFGLARTQGLKQYLAQMDVDTTYMDAFVKGLKDGANAGDDKKKAAYYKGLEIGNMISQQWVKGINTELFGQDSTKSISLQNLLAGFIQGATGKKGLMTVEQAGQVAQVKMMAIKAKQLEVQYGPLKKKGEAWMAANAKKPGVKTLPSGVQYKVIKEGAGAMPKDTSLVKVNYEGRLIDGTVFDSSYKRGESATFPLNGVIPGWTEGVQLMSEGAKYRFFIPYQLAYGERGAGQAIPPFAALVFDVELIKVL